MSSSSMIFFLSFFLDSPTLNLDEKLSDDDLLDLIQTLEAGDFFPVGLKLKYDKATLNMIRSKVNIQAADSPNIIWN